jgi:hypothetical protein
MFCFLFRFSGVQTDWPTSFKQGLAYFHQRVVNSYCVLRQSLVLWPDVGHGVKPASSRSQRHPANRTRAHAPIQAFCKKRNQCRNSKTLEPGMGPNQVPAKLLGCFFRTCRPPGPYSDVPCRPSLPKFSQVTVL